MSCKYKVRLVELGYEYQCDEHESLLVAMARTGKNGIPLGCRGGGCGVCKVQVLTGTFASKTMSRNEVSREDEACNLLLACCVFPRSDIELRVVGKLRNRVCGGGLALPGSAAQEGPGKSN